MARRGIKRGKMGSEGGRCWSEYVERRVEGDESGFAIIESRCP